MKQYFKHFLLILLVIVTFTFVSCDLLFGKQITITNPTDLPVKVDCYFFSGSDSIIIPANSSKKASFDPGTDSCMLFMDGGYFEDGYYRVDFTVSNVVLEPNRGWMELRNGFTQTMYNVKFGINDDLYDSPTDLYPSYSGIAPGQTKYLSIRFNGYRELTFTLGGKNNYVSAFQGPSPGEIDSWVIY